MVDVGPFDGLLYDPAVVGDLAAVTAPPYDVVLPHEQEQLHRASPHNISLVDLGADDRGDSQKKYTRAGEKLRRWRLDSVLVATGSPSIYPYEMRFGYRGRDRRVRGVVMEVALEELGRGIIPHEETAKEAVEDRLLLMRATSADLSPIYAVAVGPIAPQLALLDRVDGRSPDRELADEDGVTHRLWIEPMPEDLVDRYRKERLMIADGHHRYKTALAHRRERRRVQGPGPWDRVMMLVVDAASEDPPVLPIHRVLAVDPAPQVPGRRVHGLEEVLARLADDDLQFGAAFRTGRGMVHTIGRLPGDPPTVSALHRELIPRIMGIRDIRFVPDAALAEARVREGLADVALFLPPARVENIRAVVAGGGRLPQKSTYFWPKPRTGMIVRPMDGDSG